MFTRPPGSYFNPYYIVIENVYIRQDLGSAMGVKRGCLMMMVREHEDYKDLYDELTQEISSLPPPVGLTD